MHGPCRSSKEVFVVRNFELIHLHTLTFSECGGGSLADEG